MKMYIGFAYYSPIMFWSGLLQLTQSGDYNDMKISEASIHKDQV